MTPRMRSNARKVFTIMNAMSCGVTAPPFYWRADAFDVIGRYENLDNWHLEAIQTTPGFLACQRRVFHLDGVQWIDENLSHVALNVVCKASPSALTFNLILHGDLPARINGRLWQQNEIAVAPGNGDADCLFPPARFCTLTVQRHILAEHLWVRDHVVLGDWGSEHCLLVDDVGLIALARTKLYRLAADVDRHLQEKSTPSPAQIRTLRGELLDLLAAVALKAMKGNSRPLRRTVPAEVVRQARRYVMNHDGEALNVEALCRATRVSRRTLQQCFADVLGASPVAYLRLMRLGAARRLLLAAPPERRIQDVLAQLGIWHASHFAAEYRALFGELPSETLKRSASIVMRKCQSGCARLDGGGM